MASRPRGYGMTAELDRKKASKYDVDQDKRIRVWIKAVLNGGSGDAQAAASGVPLDATDMAGFANDFKDGVILCHLINTIRPGSVKKVNSSKMAFKMMENIGNFLSAAEAIGVSKVDLFQTVDLYEGQNIPQVLAGLSAIDRAGYKVGFKGPTIQV